MEAVIAVSCSGAGVGPWSRTNSSSTRVAQALRPSAAVRVECRNHHEIMAPPMFGSLVIGGIDERTHGRRRETRVRFAPKSNSMAEAQRRFDASHADAAAEVENRDVEKVDNSEAELQKEYKMTRVCDRLIEVFMIEKTTPAEWRKLLAFSAEWGNIRPYFFQRCSINSKAEEDPKRRGDLLKLARQLKEVDEDMQRHDELLGQIEEKELELDSLVSKRRKDFTGDFFEHLHILAAANFNNLARCDEIVRVAKTCLSAVEAYDAAQADGEALGEAQLKFDDILNSPSLEAAVSKIDRLAQRQELDSTLMLLMTKAYAAAKESTMMKEEVKDILLHLYNVARGNMQRLVPKEIRIIRHLLSIQDPRERLTTLAEAFSPGNELEGTNEDLLFTTPDKLLVWIDIVLDAYRTNKQGSLMKEAQKLMNPEIISRVTELRKVVEDQFM